MAFTSHHGRLVGKALAGSWRRNPDPCELSSEELAQIAPILLKSGAAGMVWWRLNRSDNTEAYPEFFEAFKRQTLEAAVHEDEVTAVFQLLKRANLEALVVKGWAIARLYPDSGMRHYGDIDLCVRLNDYPNAAKLIEQQGLREIWIDLHEGAAHLDYESETELFARSVLVPVGDTHVRVPSPEDHLRILCLHLLRHGAWRPLWLCDVALAVESRDANFDWDRFFGRDEVRRDWLGCVLGLAHQLLGARIDDTPARERAMNLPAWLTRAILVRWGRWFNSDYRDTAKASLWAHRWEPMRMLEDFYFRCDPIRATVEMSKPFNNRPRLPYQIAAFLRRAPEVSARAFRKT